MFDILVPSAPTDVSVEPSTPVSANVSWHAPKELRGRLGDIIYVIEWHTFNADGSRLRGTLGGRGTADQPKPSNVAENMYMMVPNLHAAQSYYFQVSVVFSHQVINMVKILVFVTYLR